MTDETPPYPIIISKLQTIERKLDVISVEVGELKEFRESVKLRDAEEKGYAAGKASYQKVQFGIITFVAGLVAAMVTVIEKVLNIGHNN